MVAYNFQKRFVAPIRARTKRHTIRVERAGRSRHARPGETMQLYFGLRTKHTQLIAAPLCESIEPITLDFGRSTFRIGDRAYDESALDPFAVSDGFGDWDDMAGFWRRHHPGVIVFSGVIIAWAEIEDFPERATGVRGGRGQMDLFPEVAP